MFRVTIDNDPGGWKSGLNRYVIVPAEMSMLMIKMKVKMMNIDINMDIVSMLNK